MSISGSHGTISRKHVADAIMFALSQKGKTIDGLSSKKSHRYGEDKLQEKYQDKTIWHTRTELIQDIAEKLKIHPSLWGEDRRSNDFYDTVDGEINKAKKNNSIIVWNKAGNTGILRLADLSRQTKDLMMSKGRRVEKDKQIDLSTTENNLQQKFFAILTKGKKSNTYKFALARVLLDFCKENKNMTAQKYEISYEYLSKKFLKYYWYQECKFKIKQDFSVNGMPKAVRAVKDTFGDDKHGDFGQLDPAKKEIARVKILKGVFGHARSGTSLVVPKFQKISIGNTSHEAKVFYDYDDDQKKIFLNKDAFNFFSNNYEVLSSVVLVEWARYLEKVNMSLPRLVAKISTYNKEERASLVQFRKMYLEHTKHCFYCCTKLEPRYIHVDHFIPWSYTFTDNAWNLVLACQECNCKKSNALAEEEFLKILINRNSKYYSRIKGLKYSLDLLGKNKWKPEIENHYSNCKDYGFFPIPLP